MRACLLLIIVSALSGCAAVAPEPLVVTPIVDMFGALACRLEPSGETFYLTDAERVEMINALLEAYRPSD